MTDDQHTSSPLTKGISRGFTSTASHTFSADQIATFAYKNVHHPSFNEAGMVYITPKGEERYIIPEDQRYIIDNQVEEGKLLVNRPFIMNFSDPDLEQTIALNKLADEMMAKIFPKDYARAALSKELTEGADQKLSGRFVNATKGIKSSIDQKFDPNQTHDIS